MILTLWFLISCNLALTNAASPSPFSDNHSYAFSIKEVQSSLAEINDTLYASKYEVSNGRYAAFLAALKSGGETEKLKVATVDSARWMDKLTFSEPYSKYYHSHPSYVEYPVVNISYEGATLYCNWLTEQYNADAKRKFNKVKFCLPTEQEWVTAAKGGDVNSIYPWKGSSIFTKLKKNDKAPLCNCRLPELWSNAPGSLSDGDVTAPVNAYWPNEFGLYDMSGNVSEMLADKGKTKGGSWADDESAMLIAAADPNSGYTHPEPTIGFRYFMVVLEK